MVAVEEMLCRVCGCYRGDIVVMDVFLASTLCKYDLRKGDFICSVLGNGATSDAGESISFRAANVWWRCAQYFVIAFCD